MSAETIPAEVHATMLWALKRWRTSMQPDDLLRAMLEAPVVQGWLADRSTRPAEPAPVVEAGDGMAAGDGQYVVMSSTTVRPFMLGVYETVESATLAQCGSPEKWDIFVRLSTLEAERARADAAVAALLEETDCTSLDDLRDKAAIGVSLMERIADLCKPGSRHEHWAPADDPAEIVFDLANEADELRRERDGARADRGTIAAEADHWKAKAADLETAIAVGRSQIQSRENGLVFQRDRERAEVKRLTDLVGDLSRKEVETRTQLERKSWDLSRALQDRDEAVRVAVEDEREACARIADAAGQAAAISADRKQATSQSGTSVLTGYVFAKTEAEAIARDIRARRARLRADQRAGEGGEA